MSDATAESPRSDRLPPRGLRAPGFLGNLARRVGTALVALPVLLAVLFLGPSWLVVAVVAVALAVGLAEFFGLLRARGLRPMPRVGFLVAGAFFAVSLREEGGRLRDLVRPLVGYAFLVRGFVALVNVFATRLTLGTHYDLSPIVRVPLALTGTEHVFASGSWGQILWLSLVPQLVVWPIYTVAAGLVGGALAWRWKPRRSLRRANANSPDALASSRGNE